MTKTHKKITVQDGDIVKDLIETTVVETITSKELASKEQLEAIKSTLETKLTEVSERLALFTESK